MYLQSKNLFATPVLHQFACCFAVNYVSKGVNLWHAHQARSQKILLGSAFEEKVDLLTLQYSPGAVKEFLVA